MIGQYPWSGLKLQDDHVCVCMTMEYNIGSLFVLVLFVVFPSVTQILKEMLR